MTEAINKLTASAFLKKSNSKAALHAEEFLLTNYREYLESDVIVGTKEAVSNLEAKLESIPVTEPKLREEESIKMLRHVQQLVCSHLLGRMSTAGDNAKMRNAGKALDGQTRTRVKKNYGAQVFDKFGNILTELDSNGDERELVKDFLLSQRAEEWAERKLDAASPGAYAVVIWHIEGKIIKTIGRGDAISNLLKTKGGPACRTVGVRSSTVSLVRPTAKNNVSHFSRG